MEYPLQPRQLSDQALKEFKEIAHDEFGIELSTDEAEEMGTRLLRLFSILAKKPQDDAPQITVTERELKVLKFLHHEIHDNKRSPSVRDVAKVLGVRSSRSAFRFLNKLIERGLVCRGREGKLNLSENGIKSVLMLRRPK